MLSGPELPTMPMSKPWKPRDYSSVSPYLMVSSADAVIDFLRAAFGAVPLRRIDRPDGSLMHGEVRIDDSVVMLGQPEADAHGEPTPTHVHVYVPDVDQAFRRAVEAGAEVIQEPERKEDPDRRAAVRGPSGHTWWISTQIAPGA
jgi:uncharacterized glyoxalase superfamily protein PhnB